MSETKTEQATRGAVRRGVSWIVYFLVALAVGVSIGALIANTRGGGGQSTPEPSSSSDAALAEDVDPDAPRIAALLPFAADQLLALGVTPVAVPAIRGEVPEAWDGIPTITIDHASGPNIEQLIASGADVIVNSAVYAQFTPQIENLTGAEVVMMDVESLSDVPTHLRTLGEIADREDEARALVSVLGLGTVESAPATAGDPTSVLAIFGTPHAFYAFLPGSYLGDLVERAGGELITSDMESHPVFRGLAPLSMEVVVARDPELLLVLFHGSEDATRAMLNRDPLWSELSAVKEDRVVFLSEDLYAMRPGSEVARAMDQIADALGTVQEDASASPIGDGTP